MAITVNEDPASAAGMSDSNQFLRNGAQYKESLRDGRDVWINGEKVEDVTADPTLGPGIDLMAEMFDAQFDPELRDVTTYVDPDDGCRYSRSWQIPRTLQDLQERRKLVEYTSMKTVGTFGRPPDLAPLVAVGLIARRPAFEDSSPAFAQNNPQFARNIEKFYRFGRAHNWIMAEILVDPQTDRSRPVAESPALLRVTAQESDGLRVSGAKSVGSISAQADGVIFTNLNRPDFPPEACVWAAAPIGSANLRLLCREGVSHPGSDPFDHPIGARGEEADQLLVFRDVFVPNDNVFNVGDPTLVRMYGPVILWVHWHIITRLWVKAKIFVGTAQAVVDAIGTAGIPQVRGAIADLIEYEETLRAFVLAAEHTGGMSEGGVYAPDMNLITAGRLYSIANYPRIIHTLQEICGQGLVMRFPKSMFDNPETGQYLDELLPGHEISARDKVRLMNFAWDLTSDSLAGRTELFENVNATPAPFLRERLFAEVRRDDFVALARDLAGL
jgi:4-hydroxyphenylacetate 3-monooxygenase